MQIYSTGYLRDDPRYPSYAALVSLFTAAMLLVVYSGDLMVLLVGWEVMGICSYFLVGHYWETRGAAPPPSRPSWSPSSATSPSCIGLFALAADAGTFRITGILGAVANGGLDHPTADRPAAARRRRRQVRAVPAAHLAARRDGRPDPRLRADPRRDDGRRRYLLRGPAPPRLRRPPRAALVVLAVMAAVTMVGSGLAALAQDDIKRVLAYSTIGQLGYMAGALAVGDRGAAVFHLLSHGAFKALLFLARGRASSTPPAPTRWPPCPGWAAWPSASPTPSGR